MKILHKCLIKDGQIVPDDTVRYHTDLEKFEGKEIEISFRKWKKTRTIKQNASLHLFLSQLAEALNGAGYDMRSKVMRQDIDIPWSGLMIKELIWRPVMKAKLGKKSTTEMTTEEVSMIYEIVNKVIGERCGIHIPWPNVDEIFKEK